MVDRQQLARLLETGGRVIEPLLPGRLVIYGAGNCGRKVAATAREAGFEIAAVIDARTSNSTITPESSEAKQLASQDIPVVVGIFNHATDTRAIKDKLGKAGFSRVVSYPEFHEQFGGSDDFWLTKRSYYSDRTKEILAGFDCFADEVSRQVYYDTIAYRLNFDDSLLQAPELLDQYLPRDLATPVTPVRLVDGGAFTGDTLQSFLAHGLQFEAVAAFEPDAANYHLLKESVAALGNILGEVRLFRYGLGREKATLNFRAGDSAGSGLDQSGQTQIEIVALDEFLPDFAPTFIKLDIEGAESAALRGAAKTIRKFRPRLAVCAYHRPADLWTIPQLIHELEPGYLLSLRYHQWNGFDLVVYAGE